jgi:hypothetical protein
MNKHRVIFSIDGTTYTGLTSESGFGLVMGPFMVHEVQALGQALPCQAEDWIKRGINEPLTASMAVNGKRVSWAVSLAD